MVAGAALALASGASAFTPGAGLANTPHDFTQDAGTLVDVGLCTFCHTPHKALATTLLWNHTLSTNTFSWDVPKTTAGTDFATFDGDTYKGATAKCLSCHDGTVAIGDVAWFGEGKPALPLNSKKHSADDDAARISTLTGGMAGNHPVAMPFPYQGQGSTYNGVTTGPAIDFSDWQADPAALGVRLFNDDGMGNITAGAVPGKTGIECSSCHDPHNKQTADDLFLRGTLTGNDTNYLCLKCHNK